MNKFYLFHLVDEEARDIDAETKMVKFETGITEFEGTQEEAIKEAYRMVDDEEADSVIVTDCLTGVDVYYRNRYGEQMLV